MAAGVTDRDKTARQAATSARTTTKVPVPFVVVLGHGRCEKRIAVHTRSPYLYMCRAAAIIATAASDQAVCKALSQLQYSAFAQIKPAKINLSLFGRYNNP